MKKADTYSATYEGAILRGYHSHYVVSNKERFYILNAGSKGHADDVVDRIIKLLNNVPKD